MQAAHKCATCSALRAHLVDADAVVHPRRLGIRDGHADRCLARGRRWLIPRLRQVYTNRVSLTALVFFDKLSFVNPPPQSVMCSSAKQMVPPHSGMRSHMSPVSVAHQAVDHCLQISYCVVYSDAPFWKTEGCTVWGCHLHPSRPQRVSDRDTSAGGPLDQMSAETNQTQTKRELWKAASGVKMA